MEYLEHDLTTMKDDALEELIRAYDAIGNPPSKRFVGDDDALFFFMDRHGLKQNVLDKTVVMTMVMREALTRGLKVSLEK